ncbi:beta-alanyl-bioamine nonribosomal peptide synthetase ebony [Leptinotarsa decemlineata]|uniref:beta-alanyl-bioamine nonribosomal peptide synthetase ebony n=1 Tax=Leptinotarsa decemlineata TaxID=7539 RepID=UPI003D30703B
MSENTTFSILRGSSKCYTGNHLIEIFDNIANRNEHHSAVLFEVNGQCYNHTYSELARITTELSNILRNIMLNDNVTCNNDGDYIIGVRMAPSDRMIMALLAIWKAGAAYLPLDPEFPKWRTEYIVNDAKPILIISDEVSNWFQQMELSFEDLLDRSKKIQSGERITKDDNCRVQQDIAIVLYTSGSTGKPKGVRLPQTAIMNRLQWQFQQFPFGENESVCVSKTALAFVDSVAEIWGPLLNGRTLLVVPKKYLTNPEKIVNILEKYEVQRLVLVPSLLKSLLLFLESQGNEAYLRNLRLWICSGESLDRVVVNQFYKCFPENSYRLCNFYGSTEIMADVTFYVINELKQLESHDKVPIGIPIDNTVVYLLDENRQIVQAGTVGEVFVSGLNLSAGYVNKTDQEERFIDNPFETDPDYKQLFRTGDFARIENGRLIFEGRADSQIKIGGRRVDLSEIQQLMYTLDEIEKAIVLCYKPGDIKQELLAFVTVNNPNLSALLIEAKLRKGLMWYMVPKVIVIEKMPFLVSGKIDRQELIKLYEFLEETEGEINYDDIDSEQMEAATVLFETVASVLSKRARSAISAKANFYEIGGNSINSISTISKLRERGYHIGIGEFISAKNFAEILSLMQADINMDKSGCPAKTFRYEPLKDEHKNDVIDLTYRSLYHQPGLQEWIVWNTSKSDFIHLIDQLWESLIEQNLSFVIKSDNEKITGICLNFDDAHFPEIKGGGGFNWILELMNDIENQIRLKYVPNDNVKAMNNLFITTEPSQSHQENIAAVEFMEKETLNVAKKHNFSGVLCTNISKLTQQLASEVLNYELVVDVQANQYVAEDGTKPFAEAPDDDRAQGFWKFVNE